MTTPTPTLHDILAQIESLKRDKALQPQINMLAIEQRITAATQQAVLDVNLRGELQAALGARQDARMVLERIAAIDARLRELEQQRLIALDQHERSQREMRERQRNELAAEFRHNALAMIRSARKCLNAGVNVGKFSVGFLESDPNGAFRLSDELRMGLLRFEVLEAEAAAKAEQERMCTKYANEAAA